MTAFQMYLRLVSETLLPQDITDRLGVPADESYGIGSRRRPETPPRKHSLWVRRAGDGRPEDIEPAVLDWGMDFARAVGTLTASTDVVASLVIVQRVTDVDDPLQKGVFLSATLLSWLAAAGASLDIDQYVLHDCEDD